MNNSRLNHEYIVGSSVIMLVTIFISLFSYINEPIGDDVLCYFDGALTYYLDDYSNDIGNRFTNIDQVLDFLQFTYTHWSGRMPGYFLQGLGHILPKYIQAIFTAIIFSVNIFLTLRIVHGNSRQTIKSPMGFLVLFLVLYWYRSSVFYEYMWTMVSIYSFSVLLVLLYYNFYSFSMKQVDRYNIFAMHLLGFFAGFSHEVISLWLIIAIIVGWLKNIVFDNGKKSSIFGHVGLILGYLCCVFAPGNFYRMLQSHDVITNNYVERFVACVVDHGNILIRAGAWRIFFIVAIIAIFVFIKDQKYVKQIIYDKIDIILAAVLGIFIWAKAPHCPYYGLDLWIMTIYIVMLSICRKINDYIRFNNVKNTIVIIMVILFCFFNAQELYSYSKTSFERRALVGDAVEQSRSEVVVPRFDDNLSKARYLLSYLNDQKQYDTDYYRSFYGIRLVIDDKK